MQKQDQRLKTITFPLARASGMASLEQGLTPQVPEEQTAVDISQNGHFRWGLYWKYRK